jgi:4-hydroxy-2-oxoheptanedioate aldolase
MAGIYRLRGVLASGGVAFGATTQVPSPTIVEILGRVGYDFTIIDTEHGQFDLETARGLIRAAQGSNLSPLVRVVNNDPTRILRALDAGAEGIIIPHVSDATDASKAVDACRYWPHGHRGACPLVRAADYGLADWSSYQKAANAMTLVCVLIEDLEGAENIEPILSVQGIDIVYLGAFDMSVAAGYSGNVRHPRILAALDRILDACAAKHIPVMHTLVNSPDIEAWIKKGVRLIVHGPDASIFAKACRAFLDSVSHLRKSAEAALREGEA